jgi:predicted GIY-YIG superfamily endonuclease
MYFVQMRTAVRPFLIVREGISSGLRRIATHNAGRSVYTSKFRPWQVEAAAVAFRSEKKARAFERYLKTGSGREFSLRHF